MVTKLGAEFQFVDQQHKDLEIQRKKLANEMVTIKQAIDRQDLQLKQSKIAEKEAQSEILQVEKAVLKVAQDKTALEEKTASTLGNQITLEKGAQNVLKEAQKLRAQIAEKEQKLADLQNEIARIKVDALNTAAHNKELKATCTFFFYNLVQTLFALFSITFIAPFLSLQMRNVQRS